MKRITSAAMLIERPRDGIKVGGMDMARFIRLISLASIAAPLSFAAANAASPQQLVQSFLDTASDDPRSSEAFVANEASYTIGDIGGSLRTEFRGILTAFAGEGCQRPIAKGAEPVRNGDDIIGTVVKVEWRCPNANAHEGYSTLDARFFIQEGRIVKAYVGGPPPTVDQLSNSACRLGLSGCPAR